jgi:CO/xanthine dehydrogenase FAD-binding subunit
VSGGTFLEPASLDEALALLAEHDGAALVAGGTDLVVGTRQGKRTLPETLVAIHRLPNLDGIGEDGGALAIGALATHDAIERSELVRGRWTALADASAIVGSPATRHVGTLGGNLANASPAMETGAPLVVFGAEVELRSPGGSRTVPVESLWAGPGRTTAAPGEMITGVRVPAPADGSGSAYVRLEYRRSMEIAVVGAAAIVTLAGDGTVAAARVALTAVAPTIVRSAAAEAALAGTTPTAEAIAAAAAHAADGVDALADIHASAEFRVHLAQVNARRALARALAR